MAYHICIGRGIFRDPIKVESEKWSLQLLNRLLLETTVWVGIEEIYLALKITTQIRKDRIDVFLNIQDQFTVKVLFFYLLFLYLPEQSYFYWVSCASSMPFTVPFSTQQTRWQKFAFLAVNSIFSFPLWFCCRVEYAMQDVCVCVYGMCVRPLCVCMCVCPFYVLLAVSCAHLCLVVARRHLRKTNSPSSNGGRSSRRWCGSWGSWGDSR